MSCPTLPISEFTFSVQGCAAKWLHQHHRLRQGHLYTLESQVSSEQGEAQWPSVCLGRTGFRLLPRKYSTAGPPLSSCKTGLPSCGLDNCHCSYTACETPDGFWPQHHAIPCSCVHHNLFPPQPSARWEDKAPGCNMGAGLLVEGLFILKREQKYFLRCKYVFLNASWPKALLLPAWDSHLTQCWAKAIYKESSRQSQEKGSAPASLGTEGNQKCCPRLSECSLQLNYSPGTAWSGTSACGVIGPKPWGEQKRWLEWSHCPECPYQPPSSLQGIRSHARGGPGHTTAPCWATFPSQRARRWGGGWLPNS